MKIREWLSNENWAKLASINIAASYQAEMEERSEQISPEEISQRVLKMAMHSQEDFESLMGDAILDFAVNHDQVRINEISEEVNTRFPEGHFSRVLQPAITKYLNKNPQVWDVIEYARQTLLSPNSKDDLALLQVAKKKEAVGKSQEDIPAYVEYRGSEKELANDAQKIREQMGYEDFKSALAESRRISEGMQIKPSHGFKQVLHTLRRPTSGKSPDINNPN